MAETEIHSETKPLNVILLGAPGAGKGTHSKFIELTYAIPHISTGDIFRDAISKKTPLGLKAKGAIDKGELVPDEITVGIVRERLLQKDTEKGFLLDGFPRTLAQAKALDEILASEGRAVTMVLDVTCPKAILMRRICTRRVCPKCGASFNVLTLKPKVEGICDYCGSKLVQRKDDTEAAFSTRYAEFISKTEPLVAYYRQRGLVYELSTEDGNVARGNKQIAEFVQEALSK